MFQFRSNTISQLTSKYTGYVSAFILVAIACANVVFQFLNFSLMSRFLAVKEFGNYRTFLSIISFSGIFHLGYIDGLVTRWVVDKQQPQLKVFLVAAIITVLSSWPLIFYPFPSVKFLFILSFLLINNIMSLAGGVFIKFKIFIIQPVYLLFIQVFLFCLMMVKKDNLLIQDLITYSCVFSGLITIFLILYLIKTVPINTIDRNFGLLFQEIVGDIKTGIAVLLIGIFFIAVIHLDKVILPLFVSPIQFGYYSFASSIITVLIGVIAAPINLIFSKMANSEKVQSAQMYNRIFMAISTVSVLMMCSYPLLKLLIERYLPKYTPSFQYLGSYIGMLFPVLVLQLLTTNIYRQKKLINKFLIDSLSVLITVGLVYFICYKFNIDLHYYPFVVAQILVFFVMYNEWKLSKYFTELRQRFIWLRLGASVIISLGMVVLLFASS